MKYRIILLIMACAVLISSLFIGGTMAWFSDNINKELVFESGSIKYIISGELINDGGGEEYTLVVPGQSLTDNNGEVVLTNKSSIDTQLRMQILFSYTNGSGITHNDVLYSPEDNEHKFYIDIALNSGWAYKEYVSTNPPGVIKAYEFKDTGGEFFLPAASDPVAGYTIPLLEGLYFSGDNINEDFAGSVFSLKLFFQVKQKNIAAWQDIGVLDFHVSN